MPLAVWSRRIGPLLMWVAVAAGAVASLVDRLDPRLGRTLWAFALSLALVILATLFPRRLSVPMAIVSVAAVLAFTYFIHSPGWLREAVGIAVGAVWVAMFLIFPLASGVRRGWRHRDRRSR